MKIENGRRASLIIAGVFDGDAGVMDDQVSFIPNRRGVPIQTVRGGLLDGAPVFLTALKSVDGSIWTAKFQVIE